MLRPLGLAPTAAAGRDHAAGRHLVLHVPRISYVIDIYRGELEPSPAARLRGLPRRSSPTSSPARSCGRRSSSRSSSSVRDPDGVDATRALRLIVARAVQEGRDRQLPGADHRRPGVRPPRPATAPETSSSALRATRCRSTPTSAATPTSRSACALLLGHQVPRELRPPLHRGVAPGLLAPLAHDAVALAARLPVHPAGRQPGQPASAVPQPVPHHAARRPVARRAAGPS